MEFTHTKTSSNCKVCGVESAWSENYCFNHDPRTECHKCYSDTRTGWKVNLCYVCDPNKSKIKSRFSIY